MNYTHKPRILFLCGREAAYPLNRFLIDGARTFAEVDVVAENGGGKSIVRRSTRVLLEAVPRLLSGRYDLVIVGFFGHFLMPAVRIFRRSPVLFHPFISAYETLIEDRQTYRPGSLPARLARRLDTAACRAADHLLMDTQANIDYFGAQFGLPPERFTRIYIGADERLFFPQPQTGGSDRCVILFHGSYLPLHGIDVILHAAATLNDREDIGFRLVGKGMGYERITALAGELGLRNVEFVDFVPLEKLPDVIASADICLGGHFGTSDKALRVIAGKTFQDLAMGKATIVGDTRANRELLTHAADAWFVPPSDPKALAAAIAQLADDAALRARIGAAGARTFLEKASLAALTPELEALVQRMTGKAQP